MVHSVRVSDDVFERAQALAPALGRSINQQVDHWCRLGAAVEASSTLSGMLAAALAFLRAEDARRVASGELPPEALHFIPGDAARAARMTLPEFEFAGDDVRW